MFVSSSIVPPLPPSGLSAVHTSPTTIAVYWSPPTSGTTSTGYNITYFAGVWDTIGTVTVVSVSTDSHKIPDLSPTVVYRISIVSVNGTTHSDATGPVLAAKGCAGLPHTHIQQCPAWRSLLSVLLLSLTGNKHSYYCHH